MYLPPESSCTLQSTSEAVLYMPHSKGELEGGKKLPQWLWRKEMHLFHDPLEAEQAGKGGPGSYAPRLPACMELARNELRDWTWSRGMMAQGSLHHSPPPSYPHNNNPVRKLQVLKEYKH
ncbi:Tyrosine--tRNA ligase [Varanus komodoensis]|nr:Tyrosine--tRNA ligase [Varanus komodoensis]